MSPSLLTLIVALAAMACCVSSLAIAAGSALRVPRPRRAPRASPAHRSHGEAPEHRNVVGMKVGTFAMLGRSESGEAIEVAPAVVAGVFYERMLIHRWLELEISVPVGVRFDDEPTVFLPVDIHLKKPFHPSPRITPYVALGPVFDVVVHPEPEIFFGGSFGAGTYLWVSPRWGIDVEIDYNLVAEHHIVHELALLAGPATRF